MRRLATIIAALLLAFAAVPTANAITDGAPDGDEHPMVGQLLFFVPDAADDRFEDADVGGWFTCTGTLIDADTVLTAGHCTFAVGLDGASTTADGADGNGGNDIWFNALEAPDFDALPAAADFVDLPDGNQQRYDAAVAALNADPNWYRGTASSHPDYTDAAFVLADVGSVGLDGSIALSEYGDVVSQSGYLDQFATRRGLSKQEFTAVGYGLAAGFPYFAGGDTRKQADMQLVSVTGAYGLGGVSVTFSSSPRGRDGAGGTCFGDSGGPVFEEGTNLIVAVTSFGISFNCVEPGGYYRLDTEGAQGFVGGLVP